jgi:hypothetical protein
MKRSISRLSTADAATSIAGVADVGASSAEVLELQPEAVTAAMASAATEAMSE